MTTPSGDAVTPEPRRSVNLHATSSDQGTVNQFAGNQYNQVIVLPAPVQVVRSLRADIATFTGRSGELQRVAAVEVTEGLTIYAIDGMPGVGKTALAVHISHQLADRFPDGQFFVDLHAHSLDLSPADPADVVANLLVSTGLSPDQIPDGLEARASKWRDRMAGKRILLLLDDAANTEQVSALLPGSDGCLVLVTSRRRLPGLRRNYGATIVPLGVLSEPDAVALFRGLYPHPIAPDHDSVVLRVVRLCGCLPLAITIVASGVGADEATTVTQLASDLETAQDRLDGIEAFRDEHDLGVAAAFDLSYGRLNDEQQRVLRLLSVSPGAELDSYAAAAVTDLTLDKARRNLRILHGNRLIDQPVHDRYRLHDLVKAFARAHETAPERHAALQRLLDYYQYTAAAADAHMPRRAPAEERLRGVTPRNAVPYFSGHAEAMVWLRTERANLFACLDQARRHNWGNRFVDLAMSVASFLRLDGPHTDSVQLLEEALTVARAGADHQSAARILTHLGAIRRATGQHDHAMAMLEQAIHTRQDLDDRHGAAYAMIELAVLRRSAGDYPAAFALTGKALTVLLEVEDPYGQALALCGLGELHEMTGHYSKAIELQNQALVIRRDINDRYGEAWTLMSLGILQRLTGNHHRAFTLLDEALRIYQSLRVREEEAWVLSELAVVHRLMGDPVRASEIFEDAIAMFRECRNRYAEAKTLNDYGDLVLNSGNHLVATQQFRDALNAGRAAGSPLQEARALAGLGRCLLVDRETEARAFLAQALAIFRRIGALEADELAAEVRDLTH